MQIAIIGVGNMGGAIAKGLLLKKTLAPADLILSDLQQSNIDAIQQIAPQVQVASNKDAVTKADVVILAVKPWLVEPILMDLAPLFDANKIFVSIAAGVNFDSLNAIVRKKIPLFRVMPNTAISLNESMTLIASQNASTKDEDFVLGLFNDLGKAILIPEKIMGAATSVASCGIAYALRYLRAATEGAVELGFRADEAQEIVAQTMKGAVELILQTKSHPEVEIDKVTTPGGWTIKGLNEMEAQGFSNAVIKGLLANSTK